MRLTGLLLVLLPLFCCGEQTLQVSIVVEHKEGRYVKLFKNSTESCVTETEEERTALYAALNGECKGYRDTMDKCCSSYSGCVSPDGRKKIEVADYTQCGVAQAKCIPEKIEPVCQKNVNYVNVKALSCGEPGRDFFLLPELGVTKELYGNCTAAKAKIDTCARDLKECVDRREKRREKGGEVEREPFDCENTGKICMAEVMDIDRALKCALEVGCAVGVMGRPETEAGKEEEEEKVSTANPFESLMHQMQKKWGFSWWAALGVIVAAALSITCGCCCLAYCFAMAGVRKQQDQRRWKRQQEIKERGVDRYSNVESAAPSSVRVSQYSVEEEEETEN